MAQRCVIIGISHKSWFAQPISSRFKCLHPLMLIVFLVSNCKFVRKSRGIYSLLKVAALNIVAVHGRLNPLASGSAYTLRRMFKYVYSSVLQIPFLSKLKQTHTLLVVRCLASLAVVGVMSVICSRCLNSGLQDCSMERRISTFSSSARLGSP
jgi:hypothetical protein